MARGFDNVSITEIAAAAEVSKMTVFNYFPAKEDLVLLRVDDHFEESASVVRMEQSLDKAFAEVLGGSTPDIVARIAAGQVISTQQTLVVHNLTQVLAGKSAKAVYPHAVTTANLAYDMLEHGLSRTALAWPG